MSLYLLDTNVISEPLRPRPSSRVLGRLRRHETETAIPSLVWHELQFGCLRLPPSKRRSSIERYLEEVVLPNLPILDYDRRAAEWHARERARLEAAGSPAPFVDAQIAAIAFAYDLILVTANAADFKRFDGVRVQTWK